jgi:hypothetical protein
MRASLALFVINSIWVGRHLSERIGVRAIGKPVRSIGENGCLVDGVESDNGD